MLMKTKSNRLIERLDAPSTAGNVTLRINRGLLCPACNCAIRSFHAHPQDTNSAIAVDCPQCHARILIVEVNDEDLD
jgi:hypothetical protein